MNKILLPALLLAAVVFVSGCTQAAGPEAPGNDQPPATGETKVFSLTGENFKFVMDGVDNPDLKVSVGDTVRIEFESIDGFHDWTIEGFNAATSQVQTGSKTSVEFVADKAGTFEYYCSVGQHRANGMKGSLIVE